MNQKRFSGGELAQNLIWSYFEVTTKMEISSENDFYLYIIVGCWPSSKKANVICKSSDSTMASVGGISTRNNLEICEIILFYTPSYICYYLFLLGCCFLEELLTTPSNNIFRSFSRISSTKKLFSTKYSTCH
jgi:hypothetical protein